MDELPPLPKGYMLAPFLATYSNMPLIYWLGKVTQCGGGTCYKWIAWGQRLLSIHWDQAGEDHPNGPFFAIPKPRYTCPLEVSSDS